jgi:hypothetical protein
MKSRRARSLIIAVACAIIIAAYVSIQPESADMFFQATNPESASEGGLRNISPDAALIKYLVEKLSDIARF